MKHKLSAVRSITTVAIAIGILLALGACSDDDDGGGTATETAAPASTGFHFDPYGSGRPGDLSFVFAIDEIGLGQDGYVKILNFSTVTASTGGLFLCQPPDCIALPNTQLAGGEAAFVVASDKTDQADVLSTWADLTLNSSDGEVGIYASEDTADPNQVRAYLQWGSDPHSGTETAIDAGFWIQGGFAPSSDNAIRLYQNEGGLWLFDE